MCPISSAKKRTISDRMRCALRTLVFLSLALALTVSCSEDESAKVLPQGSARFSLSLHTSGMQTRVPVVQPGEKDYNEDVLHRLDIFFYPLAADGESQDGIAAVYHMAITGLSADGRHEIKDGVLSKGTMNALGLTNDGDECYIYAVANSPVSLDNDAMTIGEIKQQRLEAASFAEASDDRRKQNDFIMTGETKGRFVQAGATLTADIPLKRVAAKLEFCITKVEDYIDDAVGNRWIPNVAFMKIKLNNGVKATDLSGTKEVDEADYFHTNGYSDMKAYTGQNGTYIHEFPFYSYPSNWDSGTDREAYATLVVPWARVKNDESGNPIMKADGTYEISGQYISTFYQIPVSNAKGIFANAYYKMNFSVGIIGSFDPLEPVALPDNSYIIADWSEGTILPIAMKKINYLAIAVDEVNMYNEKEGSVDYVTSDIEQTEVRIDSVSFVSYYGNTLDTYVTKILPNDGNSMSLYKDRVTIALSNFTINKTGGKITLKTDLDLTKIYVPITVSVSVRKSGLADEVIKFRIYPPIYIVGHRSQANVWVNGDKYERDDNTTYHYQNVDFGTISLASTVDGTADNNNRNIYMIHISSLSDGTFSIGDTRQTAANNLGINGLTNYFPTQQQNSGIYMLSPNFIVASSYGKTVSVTYSNAQKRCASYQEDGYPAGRWRIPTEGEIMFAVGLSNNQVFPKLFNGQYWAASGRVYSQSSNSFSTASSSSVRCVYDIWYWGEEHQANGFTWGDR